VKAHQLDQPPYLRLGVAEQDRSTPYPQATSQHRQVEHQRCIGEHQLAQVDDHISLGADCAHESLPSTSLRRPVLVAPAPQGRGLVIEIDDARKPTESEGYLASPATESPTLLRR
jgi:hypothetical protein